MEPEVAQPAEADRVSWLMRDLPEAASYIAKVMSAAGFKADFSVASLQEADRFVDANCQAGAPTVDCFFGRFLNPRTFALGAYFGEVAIRALGCSWVHPDAVPDPLSSLVLRLGDDREVRPIQIAEGRLAADAQRLVASGANMGMRSLTS